MERISGTTNPIKDRQPGDLFTTETAGLSRRRVRSSSGSTTATASTSASRLFASASTRTTAHARLQRLDPGPELHVDQGSEITVR